MAFNNLEDTCGLMTSGDYKDRFIAEYTQTKIRYERLKAFNNKIEAANMTMQCPVNVCSQVESKIEMPKHDCPDHLLREQQRVMGEYLHTLELRAVIEHIDL